MRIERYAYENCTAKYALELDEELVQEYNKVLHNGDYILPEGFIDLTLKDIVEMYKGDSPRYDEKITHWNYEYPLGSIVEDLINDDIWSNYIETVDGDTYDWDDELIED